jgi:hypothetical protein
LRRGGTIMIENIWIKGAILIIGVVIITLLKFYWPTSIISNPIEKVVDQIVIAETGVDIDPQITAAKS